MPALIAHHFFGQDVLAEWQYDAQLGEAGRQAFLLGCQGPDPFFFPLLNTQIAKLKRLGNLMHEGSVQESLECLRRATKVLPSDRQSVLEAYVRGWLCHFSMDSVTHPLIIHYEQALCNAGYPGLGPDSRSEVHAQIESDIDSALLSWRTGETIKSFRPASEILLGSDSLLDWIGVMYRRVAAEVYDFNIPIQAFGRSLKDMRATYNALYSPSGIKRVLIGKAERIVRKHSLAQAISHRAEIEAEAVFDNSEHRRWANPFTGQESEESFQDLYSRALAIAVARQYLYTAGASVKELVGELNFAGQPVN